LAIEKVKPMDKKQVIQESQKNEITNLLELLLKQPSDQKRYALLNLAEVSMK
jgi:hypothetical protein